MAKTFITKTYETAYLSFFCVTQIVVSHKIHKRVFNCILIVVDDKFTNQSYCFNSYCLWVADAFSYWRNIFFLYMMSHVVTLTV